MDENKMLKIAFQDYYYAYYFAPQGVLGRLVA
jgi:hypothetical protein